jgi:hypothetical protein
LFKLKTSPSAFAKAGLVVFVLVKPSAPSARAFGETSSLDLFTNKKGQPNKIEEPTINNNSSII